MRRNERRAAEESAPKTEYPKSEQAAPTPDAPTSNDATPDAPTSDGTAFSADRRTGAAAGSSSDKRRGDAARYEYVEAKGADRETKARGFRIWLAVLMILLAGWFAASFIRAAVSVGAGAAFRGHFLALFTLAAAEYLLWLFARGRRGVSRGRKPSAFDAGAVPPQASPGELAARQSRAASQSTAKNAGMGAENETGEDALRVYRDRVELVRKGETRTIARDDLADVTCHIGGGKLHFFFLTRANERLACTAHPPRSELKKIEKALPFRLFRDAPAARETKRKAWSRALILLPCALVAAAGVVVIALHGSATKAVPITAGVSAIALALAVSLAAFDDVPAIRRGVLPIALGAILTAVPLFLCGFFLETGTALVSIFTEFGALHAPLSLFFAIGPFVILLGAIGLSDCRGM